MKQFRVTYSSGTQNGVVFIDASTEQGARDFFALAFPGRTVLAVSLQPVDLCAAYERAPVRS